MALICTYDRRRQCPIPKLARLSARQYQLFFFTTSQKRENENGFQHLLNHYGIKNLYKQYGTIPGKVHFQFSAYHNENLYFSRIVKMHYITRTCA